MAETQHDSLTPVDLVWFQASGRGNGIGLTAIRVFNSAYDMHQVLFIYILPKFWREVSGKQETCSRYTLIESDFPDPRVTLVLFERDALGVPSTWAAGLRSATSSNNKDFSPVPPQSPPASEEAWGDTEHSTGSTDKLWAEIVSPLDSGGDLPMSLQPVGSREPVDGFWQLVRERVVPLISDPPPGARLMLHEPSARKLFLELFLRLLGEQVARRRPHFLSTREPLSAVRGRIVVDSLVERAMRRSVAIWCEFDSLDANTRVWQALRAAVAHCSHEVVGVPDVLELAVEIDARLSDVSMEPVHEILRLEPMVDPAIHDRDLQKLYRMALSILRSEVLLAEPLGEIFDGLIFTFKIASSDLWEDLIIQAIAGTTDFCAAKPESGRSLFHGGQRKSVDIAVSLSNSEEENSTDASRTVLVLDAKYKPSPGLLGSAQMSDQYQIYAYANLWGVPAFLVYPTTRQDGHPRPDTRQAFNNRGQYAGILVLPFPGPGQSRIPLSASELSHIIRGATDWKLVAEVTRDIDPDAIVSEM